MVKEQFIVCPKCKELLKIGETITSETTKNAKFVCPLCGYVELL